MAARELRVGIGDAPLPRARAYHEDHARLRACSHKGVFGTRRAVHEVPGSESPFLAFHQQQAFARKDEEVFLVRFRVVEPARLSRLEHRERDPDIAESVSFELRAAACDRHVGFEDAAPSESFVGEPGSVTDVDDEPAFGRRREARVRRSQSGFLDHGPFSLVSAPASEKREAR